MEQEDNRQNILTVVQKVRSIPQYMVITVLGKCKSHTKHLSNKRILKYVIINENILSHIYLN